MSAAACRTGFLLAARVSWTAAPAGLAASICLSSAGFALQTLGFKDGNTVVVCTCAAVSSMLTGQSLGSLGGVQCQGQYGTVIRSSRAL